MAITPYITLDNITHTHIRQFIATAPATVQPYVDKANKNYEDLCRDLGVDVTDIETPLCQLAEDICVYYAMYRFAEDSIGVNDDYNGKNLYADMYERFQQSYADLKPKLTPYIIMGDSDNNPRARSVSFGKRRRTA